MKVTDLINEGKSEYEIEMARNKLRVYELARFKQFRRSMLEKLHPKGSRHVQHTQQKRQSGFAQMREASTSSAPGGQHSVAKNSTESVDLSIDVKVETLNAWTF